MVGEHPISLDNHMEVVLIFRDYYGRSALSPCSPQNVAYWSKEEVVEPPFDVLHAVPHEQKKTDSTAHGEAAL